MNKCLVTTLKASTNNEALSKYNVLTIKINTSDEPTLDTQALGIGTTNCSINSSTVGLYKSGISGELLPYPQNIINEYRTYHFENKNGIIEVNGKYNINNLSIGSNGTVRMKELYGIPATIDHLIIRNIEEEEIDANKLSNSINRSKIDTIILPTKNKSFVNKLSKNTVVEFGNIETIRASFSSLFDSISLDDLANNVKIKILSFDRLKEGNMSSLAKLVNLTRIEFVSSIQNRGDIMDFINPWIQAGKTSGKIHMQWLNTQRGITLNGSPLSLPSGVTNGIYFLNWTSDGTVTFTAS